MKKQVLLCAILVGLVTGYCDAVAQIDTLPTVPMPKVWDKEGAEFRFDPPPEYVEIWHEVERCLGRTYDINRVRFYMVVADSFNTIQCDGGRCFGKYEPREHSLYFPVPFLGSVILLKHEFIHALGVQFHPPEPFLRCADWTGLSHPSDGPQLEVF